MRYTLLELVQSILSSMESDEVDSITDTVEAWGVALLCRDVFYDCAADRGWPEHEALFELNASGSDLQPTLMTLPENVIKTNWIRYNTKLATETNAIYTDIEFVPFTRFLERQSGYQTDVSAGQMTITSNTESFEMLYATNKQPSFYTVFDNNQIIFDSYASTIDTTLQKSKTMCHGLLYPTFTLEDSFAPDLAPNDFSYFRNKAKFRAFSEFKQVQNTEALGEARRQKIVSQLRSRRVPNVPEVYRHARYGRPVGSSNLLQELPKNLRNGS